ncbi:DEAD/DEAH box helicase [Psychrobacter sp. APC 3350]|uniref:DEAD/DEAH box helicase n=1 Tax=Psychrobacter sp. APC 3350 TaxID=3035195 RepID=UPI0025B41EEA|nr:DEAD/DEAH box helicase [Psychrobacter sp. APC 3350]MDN3453394.1 DEAD/DEAH box helicase [Psychrobacter sp. APC 3350]
MRDAHTELDKRVQRWIFNQGWHGLREVQAKAIAPILSGQTDVLISAATAAGKTEAFFLPACSAIAHQNKGVGILYISPLKALINDQYRRLQSLAELLDMQVTPWHGDSPLSKKKQQKKSPSGIILITPESLESLLIRDAGWVKQAFGELKYIVIDEFHAFLGSERGQHLLSLLNRLEHVAGRLDAPIPRVALSATLGDLETVPLSLRPNKSLPCVIIKDTESTSNVKVQLRGYVEPSQLMQMVQIDGVETNYESNKTEEERFTGIDLESAIIKSSNFAIPYDAQSQICTDLYRFCRGGNHLIFANSRKRTELIATMLSEKCEQNIVPNEFFPHHGSLAKELREGLEQRLQKEDLPTTAVCTMTLELGIDIGKVDSVVQVTAPHSVSSLRQRLGRSGRRGGSSVLRMLITEKQIDVDTSLVDRLRLQLIQSLAMIRLLIASRWFEPADTSLYHFSTLLHQVLATIGQWGGIRADQIYTLLCRQGPFQKITPTHFKSLLSQMGMMQLITQLGNQQLVLGVVGERIVGHYTFYAVFKTPEEYRLVAGSKTLGTLPVTTLLLPEQYIIFAGIRWQVKDIDMDKKVIYVSAVQGGGQPPDFDGDGDMSIHDRVRQEMYDILSSGDYRISVGDKKVDFADKTARELFKESIETFDRCQLRHRPLIDQDGNTYIFMWRGDKIVNTLAALLTQHNFSTERYAGVICINKVDSVQTIRFLSFLASNAMPSATGLAENVPNKIIEKFDEYLPEDLLNLGYGAKAFDIDGLSEWLQLLFEREVDYK